MLNKNDPLIGAVQEVMKRNQAEREAARLVNEKFGVHDRKALPHEQQNAWDAAYKTVLTEGVEALDEDYDPEKLRRGKKVKKGTEGLRRDRHGPIKDFGDLIAQREKADAVTGGDTAAASIKAMHQLYGKDKRWKNAIKKVTVDEEALDEDYDSKAAGRKRESDELAKMATSGARTMKKPEWKKNWKKMSDKFKDTADRQNREATTGMRKKDALGEENDIDHPNKRKLDVAKPFGDLTSADFKKLRSMKESDVTSPSSMGIKKPDYATGTPDYANKGPQMVNRAAKTSAPAGTVSGTVKEAVMNKVMKKLKSVNEGAKVDRMVRHIKSSEMKAGKSPEKAEDIAWATANKRGMLDNKNKKVDEGFNNRHNSSVNASVEEQVVAEIAAYPGTPAGLAASSSSMQTAERQRRMGERRSELIAQRQQGGDVAPRPQPNMSLQRRQSGDVAPRPQSSVALQRQQSGDVAPRPQGQASPMMGQGTSKSSVKPNAPGVDRGRALQAQKSASALGGFGANKTLKTAPAAAPAAAAPVKKTVPAARPKTVTSVKKPTALQRQAERSRAGRDAAVTGPGGRRG